MNIKTKLLTGLFVSAMLTIPSAPSYSQIVECCNFHVRHDFKLCLGTHQIPQVIWSWNLQASVWNPFQTATNIGSQTYPVPSSDTKMVQLIAPQDCAVATAVANFSVQYIPGTNCIEGYHETLGRACTRCRGFGALSTGSSKIQINFGTFNPNSGGFTWTPTLNDVVSGGCRVQNTDPVYMKIEGIDGSVTNELMFDLRSAGVVMEDQDQDGTASIRFNRSDMGFIEILMPSALLMNQRGHLRLRHENGIMTEVDADGFFRSLPLPQVGQPVPDEIPVPADFDLSFRVPDGQRLTGIEMGGGGTAGETPPTIGDTNGDGCVNDLDLLNVLFAFGMTGSGLPEDLNADGRVDDEDLLMVLLGFGNGC
ncbi:MAG: hypothetical protein KIT45_07940 [Fimbriimonadia bacterium]|nr:hypothetical protein [Fimbriimonadia bacterium]